MIVVPESKRQAMERALASGGYDWASGMDLNRALDAEEAADEERRMKARYQAWAAAHPVTYALKPIRERISALPPDAA